MKIILGSQSRGRKKILQEMGYQFDVVPANIDEKAIRHADPRELVLSLARAKADALRSKISEPAILITSDQVVVWGGAIREKPENEKEAREFLEGYGAHPAETVTAVVVTNIATGKQADGIDVARVHFSPFSDEDVESIVRDAEIFRMAGGFTIEGSLWKQHVKKVDGARDSVIGLPKSLTERLIREVE